MDADGSTLVVAAYPGRLYRSIDAGTTWTELRPMGDVDQNWQAVSMNSDGLHIVAAVDGGSVWTSSDGGTTWSDVQPAGVTSAAWQCCALSADGSRLVAGANQGRLYTGLVTWSLSYACAAGGVITGATSQTVNQGASGTSVTAVPQVGYHFVTWSDGSTVNPRTDTNVTADITITAAFAIDTFTITPSAGSNGSIDPSGSMSVNYGSTQSFTINPSTDYHVQDVLVDGGSVGAVTSYTFMNLTENHTIAVTFAINPITISTYTLTYTAGANGTISGTSPQTVNQGASSTAVTATPNGGYHFVSWSDGSLTAARTDTNVTVNVDVSASFAININIHRYTLTANVSGSGSVAKSPDQPSYTHGSSVQLMATPATGWHFVGWSGDLAGSTNPVTITMDVSKTVTATYAPVAPFPVSPRHTMVLTIDIKTMTVDGAKVTLDAPAALVEDRTLVPLRAVVEHLGGTISWNAKTRQATLKARGITISLTIGKSTALVNGKSLAIDPKNSKVLPILSSGRTMLPLRFVAENLGLQVAWDAKTKAVTLSWGD
jgi:uncharacterized repeat protein (TIGR02543 family)